MKSGSIQRLRSKFPIAQCAAVGSSRQGERDDDQNRCDSERDPHTEGDGLGPRRCDVGRRRCEREHSNMDNERLASAHRTEGVCSALPDIASSCPAMIGFIMNFLFSATPEVELTEQ